MSTALPPAQAILLQSLIAIPPNGITSRVLSKTAGGTVTLFAFAAGEELSEHTAPFDALVWMLEGQMTLTVGGQPIEAAEGVVVRMPAHVPHALAATEPSRMLLIMLREPKQA
jgi:quercetin dioxygenase-like cupin family protein